MHFDLRQSGRVLVSSILIAIFAVPPNLLAQAHLVNPADLEREVLSATHIRQQNVDKVRQLFSSPAAEKALKSAHMDAQQVKIAIATLSDAELAQLAARADKTQHDLAAGTLSDRDLLVILVAIAALILIIVAVR
jgi:hypothetical protein